MIDPNTPSRPPALPPERKRLLVPILALAAAVPILAALSLWVVTRSWVIILLATPGLETKLGGDVKIGSADYRGRGRVVLEELTLRTRAHEGVAAEALRVARATVVLDMTALLRGEVRIKDLELAGVVLRFSEDARDPGVFNFEALAPDWSLSRTGKPFLPPSVRIGSAVIEVGTHTGSQYTKMGHRRVTGRLYPRTDSDGWYRFELEELKPKAADPGEQGLVIKGEWNVETLEHWAQIEGLVLNDETVALCPQMARLWLERMNPKGPVGKAFVEWKKGEPFKAELSLDAMALTIPIPTKDLSDLGDFGPGDPGGGMLSLPRMHVESGTLRLEGDRITLEKLKGEFRDPDSPPAGERMEYSVSLSIHDLPKLDWENHEAWTEQVLEAAPFEMRLDMHDFSLGESAASTTESVKLPPQVADILTKFNLTGWTLSTEVEMTRAAPAVGDGGELIPQPIHTKGQAFITEASGAFQGFPYPLDDVSAYVQFDNEKVIVHYLTATGSNGASLRMSGTITPPGQSAAIALTLTARQLPLDDRFRKALRGRRLATYDRALHKPSYTALEEAGLFLDEAAIEEARRTRQQKIAERVALRAEGNLDDPRLDDVDRDIERLGTLIAAGPFELGGTVDLDLTIERPGGTMQAAQITGIVSIHRAGVVYERFPYPIFVLGGKLRVEKDRIAIVPDEHGMGLPIATPGGGRGMISGEVRLPAGDPDGHVEPDLEAYLVNDYLSDLLFAAMPLPVTPDEDSKPSLIAGLLSGAGLRGWLNLGGTVSVDDEGEPTFEFTFELYDGVAEPTDELFQTMRELDLPSPRGLTLDSVEALLRITPERIDLLNFAGRHDKATITASGHVDLASEPIEARLDAEFNDLALESYMVDLTPGLGPQGTAALWDRYQPQGTYDAKLHYETGAGKPGRPELVIWPNELRLVMEDQPVTLICESGALTLSPHQVSFSDFEMQLRCGDRDDGRLVLDGSYGLAEGKKGLTLHGNWTKGQLASPLITETLRLIGAENHAERYRGYEPTGKFDARFTYESQHGSRPRRYEFTVRPDTVGLRVNDTPIYADLDPEAELVFTGGRIVLRDVAGTHAGGRFLLDGAIETEKPVDVDLEVGYLGRIDSPQLRAILPEAVRSTLESLNIQAAEPVGLRDAWLRMVESDEGDGWEIAFAGQVETKGASIELGETTFTEVDGVFEIVTERKPGSPPGLEVVARADRALVLGRELTNVEARLLLVDEGKAVDIRDLRAHIHGGVITGEASIGLVPESGYHAAIDIAGVSLEGIAKSSAPEAPSSRNTPTGEMYGSLTVGGDRGVPESRRGRGAVRVAWGRMASMPLTLRLLQLLQLMPPLSGSLDFADVGFYVNGDRIVFERLFLECSTLQLIGEGEMSFPGLELNMRFRTRGTVPLVKEILGGLSDQLYIVEVTGPLADPKARLVPLPGLGRSEPDQAVPVAQLSANNPRDRETEGSRN